MLECSGYKEAVIQPMSSLTIFKPKYELCDSCDLKGFLTSTKITIQRYSNNKSGETCDYNFEDNDTDNMDENSNDNHNNSDNDNSNNNSNNDNNDNNNVDNTNICDRFVSVRSTSQLEKQCPRCQRTQRLQMGWGCAEELKN